MLNFDNYVSFSKGEEPIVGLRNFWDPEDGFVWSKGKWAEVTFSFADIAKKPNLAELIIDVDVYKHPDSLPGQNVLVYVNGLRIGSSFITRRLNYIAPFDPKILKTDENVLIFDTPDSSIPKDFGGSDTRQLGVQFFSLQIRKGG